MIALRQPLPTLLLLSGDKSLASLVREASGPGWRVEHVEDAQGGELFARPNIRLVVVDDELIGEGDRGWLLGQIRARQAGVPLMYVTAFHDPENEKRARAGGAHYYTSKPLDKGRFVQVLQSFLKARGT